jgi:pyruvate/2-oxoglutarate/acetoin dehydrogenase E1 component
MHPVAEIMFGDFLTLAADQIVNHAAKYPSMYGQTIPLPLVIRTPMGGGRGYGPTHSQSLEKIFMGIPGLQILSPSHFHPAGEMLQQAVRLGKPTLFIENKLLYGQPLKLEREWDGLMRESSLDADGFPWVTIHNYPASKQPDVSLVAYGGVSRLLEPLLLQLANDEIWVKASLPGRISPLVGNHILESAAESHRVVIIEEGPWDFGWGAEVAARIYTACYKTLAAPIQRVGADLSVIPAARKTEDQILVSSEKILQAIFEVLK